MLIVGAGFSGAVVARVLADNGKSVHVIDKRPHIGGNAHDYKNGVGILVHKYGPHVFHTNSDRIFSFLSQFTDWRPYVLRVRALVNGKLVPMPVNAETVHLLCGVPYGRTAQYLNDVKLDYGEITNSREMVLSRVGYLLCDKLFEGYTSKQWGMDLRSLDPSVAARIPVRTNTDDRYFTDKYQFMPVDGYTVLFEKMLDHPNIKVTLNEPYQSYGGHVVWTGPIDEYYDYKFGPLPYRSLRFEHETVPVEQVSPWGFISHPGLDRPYTRVTEFKNLTGQKHPMTALCTEYPTADGDPYYPIPRPANDALYKKYEAMARVDAGVTFVGRLAQYRYYNMDQAVGAAITAAGRLIG